MDGFPLTREHWSAMIEQELQPDFVLSLEEGPGQSNLLLGRFCQLHGLPDPASLKATATPVQEGKEEEGAKEVLVVCMYHMLIYLRSPPIYYIYTGTHAMFIESRDLW